MLILIVEDERPIAEVLAAVVEDLGFQVQVAHDGRRAFELACSSWPALVLTDLMMPLMTGKDLIAALRVEAAASNRPPIPVILMTAVGVHRTADADATAVLAKPFDLDDLEQLLQHLLAR